MEADLAFQGIDFRDYYRPRGGTSRLTLRRLATLVRHLPSDSATARAQGDGFSLMELLVMESGLAGPLSPRHPYRAAEITQAAERSGLLKERQAYYAALAEAQSSQQVEQAPQESPAEHDGGDNQDAE